MKIAISGSTGFIGKQLSEYLLQSGNELIAISRNDFVNGSNQLAKIVNSADVIINLAGSSVLCRWNKRNKEIILSSRIQTTRTLVDAIQKNGSENRPKLFINASAIGIYQNSGVHDEFSSAFDSGFLASVCKAWENETTRLNDEIRVCRVRIGIVLGASGGSLGKMLPLFKAGLGGKIGSGKQSFSFIHILDFCRAVEYLIHKNSSSGVYNMVSPEPITNVLFTKALSECLHCPAIFTVPEFALKLVYGDAAELLTKGACVKPARLLEAGFQFKFPDIKSALADII